MDSTKFDGYLCIKLEFFDLDLDHYLTGQSLNFPHPPHDHHYKSVTVIYHDGDCAELYCGLKKDVRTGLDELLFRFRSKLDPFHWTVL